MTCSTDQSAADPLDVARRLAAALDACDWNIAAPLLAKNCAYRIRDEIITGREAIMSSYRQADNWARANLDSITYESDVESLPDGRVRIQYLDRILHKNNRHDHRCCQVITVGGDDLIVRIEHEDLAGEREAIDDFFASAGLRRDCDEAT